MSHKGPHHLMVVEKRHSLQRTQRRSSHRGRTKAGRVTRCPGSQWKKVFQGESAQWCQMLPESKEVRIEQSPRVFDMDVWATLGSFLWRSDGVGWEVRKSEDSLTIL